MGRSRSEAPDRPECPVQLAIVRGTVTDFAQAFFHRPSTHSLISEISQRSNWTIFLGSGATIDRTGMSWPDLIYELLAAMEPDDALRRAILAKNGEIRTATIVYGRYKRRDELSQLDNDIRRLLYQSRRYMQGRLLEAVASLCCDLAQQGQSVIIATTNYDDYIVEELWKQIAKRTEDAPDDQSIDLNIIVANENAQVNGGIHNVLPDDAGLAGAITCVFVHGFLPRINSRFASRAAPVVLSEQQYYETYARTRGALHEVLRGRNTLLLGTAVTDPPLVDALLATAEERGATKRYAVIPLQSGQLYEADRAVTGTRLPAWNSSRLEQIEVNAIYTDFYTQVGQLVHEVAMCMSYGDGSSMLNDFCPRRYGSRLVAWWFAWQPLNCGTPSKQVEHHSLLVRQLEHIKEVLRAPTEENLKLEIWIRWHPEAERFLGLWASSVGTWRDTRAMRTDEIGVMSRYHSVRAFCNGYPTFFDTSTSGDADSRWKTYLGVPIWLDRPEGNIPVAIVTLASMADPLKSSVTERNLERLDSVLDNMRKVGSEIVEVPSPKS